MKLVPELVLYSNFTAEIVVNPLTVTRLVVVKPPALPPGNVIAIGVDIPEIILTPVAP